MPSLFVLISFTNNFNFSIVVVELQIKIRVVAMLQRLAGTQTERVPSPAASLFLASFPCLDINQNICNLC